MNRPGPDPGGPKRAGVPRMLARGMLRRCPRCGSGGLFRRYFTMVERCPRCGHRFEERADDGFFLGALTVNIGVTQGAVVLVLLAYIIVRATGGDGVPLAPILIPAGIMAVVLPILFYPFAKTIWAAIECSLHAMDRGPR